ncbi:hypothetical protein ACF09H_03485 [Streptomyces sp. NPDC014983]|uniref:hypothetical protein n=1 Tax=unclassified Streptomyces TaxID=2593676 RepID=UPI0024A4098B|nr:hypothetical protein [Streptomyces hygroscopicus]GLX47758.1 hypothetical protein Shyhy01_07080 [Streptomyces hygroscopicus subsp. hygroscopicus]
MDGGLAQAVAAAVGQGALDAVGARALEALLGMIRQRFRRDQGALSALDGAASDPAPLIASLERYIQMDPDFAADLRDWLKEAERNPSGASSVRIGHTNQISGTVHGSVIQGQNIKGRFSFRGLLGRGE